MNSREFPQNHFSIYPSFLMIKIRLTSENVIYDNSMFSRFSRDPRRVFIAWDYTNTIACIVR